MQRDAAVMHKNFRSNAHWFKEYAFSRLTDLVMTINRASSVQDVAKRYPHISEYIFEDVLQDMEVRQGIKEFSDWPTIPQLYVKGEFVGGSDIMMEMYEAGELGELMAEKKVAPAAE